MLSPKLQSETSIFKPGQGVGASGVYNAVHHPEHRKPHPLLMKHGETFPKCPQCDATVFLLILAAPHLSEDADFGARKPQSP